MSAEEESYASGENVSPVNIARRKKTGARFSPSARFKEYLIVDDG
jgi:hypothetical protein